MPPAIQSFIQAPEQVLLNQARATVPSVLQPASSSHASGSTSAPKFHAMTGQKRQHSEGGGEDEDEDDEDGDDDEGGGSKGKNPRKRNSTSTGRRKIEISYIDNKAKRHVSFTKRKAGLMKKVRTRCLFESARRACASGGDSEEADPGCFCWRAGVRAQHAHRHGMPYRRRIRDRARLHVRHPELEADR